MRTFQNEENALMKNFIDSFYFNEKYKFSNLIESEYPEEDNDSLPFEMIVRPECNQNCEYCYIARHGKSLYPIEERVDNATILKNFDAILKYTYHTKGIFIKQWEFFAGDLFYDDFFFDLMDVLYSYLKEIFIQYKSLVLKTKTLILMPCNGSFIHDDEKVKRFKEYHYKFKEIGWPLILSLSIDGKYVSDTREGLDQNDPFFEKALDFASEMGFCFHPMVSASNVKYQVENYKWWIEELTKRSRSSDLIQPMLLEVRNDEWTEENLRDYAKYLDTVFEYRLKTCNNNIDELTYHLYVGDGKNNTLKTNSQYDPIVLDFLTDYSRSRISCSIQNMLHVTLNNLSLCPCHRLTYKQFSSGHFITDSNNNIIDFEAFNSNVVIVTHFLEENTSLKCSSCDFRDFCMKGCLGAQFESSGELYMPIPGVCRFLKFKCCYLAKKYIDLGILESAIKQKLVDDEYINEFEQLVPYIESILSFDDTEKVLPLKLATIPKYENISLREVTFSPQLKRFMRIKNKK